MLPTTRREWLATAMMVPAGTIVDRALSGSAQSPLAMRQEDGSDTLRWVAIYSPSGFEGYFREIGRSSPDAAPRALSAEERTERDKRYGIRYR